MTQVSVIGCGRWGTFLGWYVLISLIINEYRSILESLVEAGFDIYEAAQSKNSLEDVFHALTENSWEAK